MRNFSEMLRIDVDNDGVSVASAFWDVLKSQDHEDHDVARFRANHVNPSRPTKGVAPDITPDEAIKLKAAATHCKLCGVIFLTETAKHLEHDHTNGRVRGIVCIKCNTALGYFERFIRQPKEVSRMLTHLADSSTHIGAV